MLRNDYSIHVGSPTRSISIEVLSNGFGYRLINIVQEVE